MAYDGTKPATGSSLVSSEIRENFRALKEDGIVAIGDALVTRSKLKTSTGYITGTLSVGEKQTILLSDYAFFPNLAANNTTYPTSVLFVYATSNPGSSTPRFYVHGPTGGVTFWINYRYITASLGFKGCILDLPNGNKIFYEFEDAPPDFENIITAMSDDNKVEGYSIISDPEEYDVERKKSLENFFIKAVKTKSGEDYERVMSFYNQEKERSVVKKVLQGRDINGKDRLG